ncbi:Cro/C1-type HTH DNA-binding domain-containing protein [Paenibacillus tianmuensis]|uniref:Cro/C1-type HTH DNA-binding domain-containing protein n=1 Tax=Paenibacillus tianmuensis TaxID=624147 RepID=A0A1G4TK26_9BACL|nr:helix-turn-helix transcriptional regulator [Paenibacillus tianmuensis]SCW81770.1 Cro/C1-type HTH DNA-binding domain-containing protein [Paenibacillus tianmuensis]
MRVDIRSLRSEIEDQMKLHGYNLNKVAELTGINAGNLSMVLNGRSRAMTIGQLDALAEVFGKAPGWLYELYTEECISDNKLSRPRIIPYLVRCAEIGRVDCIEPVVSKILDNPKNASIIFAAAEKLFENGRLEESGRFYQQVVDNIKDSFSELMAISQYRLFLIAQGTDEEKNWKSVIQFEPFRRRLPEYLQLAALLKLAKVCYSLEKINEVEKFAEELTELSSILYKLKMVEEVSVERPLIYYFGMGLLFEGAALEKRGLYEEAKNVVQRYADLSWFEPLDELGWKEVEKFNGFAKANLYTLEVFMGNDGILNEYADFLESLDRLNETLSGLTTIINSANIHGFCVDHILQRFAGAIDQFDCFVDDLINSRRYLWFCYHRAVYEFTKERYENGIKETIFCISLCLEMKRYEDLARSVVLFEKHRNYASESQVQYYESIRLWVV